MSLKKLLAATAFALLASLGLAQDEKPAKGQKDIVDTAMGAKNFTNLVKAVKAADLVDTLKGTGPFTVFAPTDAAFKALVKDIGQEKFDAILADKEKLKKILMVHVVKDKAVMAKDVMEMDGKMVNDVKITVKDGKVMVGEAKVIRTDIKCKNGVIHVIDKVLLPEDK